MSSTKNTSRQENKTLLGRPKTAVPRPTSAADRYRCESVSVNLLKSNTVRCLLLSDAVPNCCMRKCTSVAHYERAREREKERRERERTVPTPHHTYVPFVCFVALQIPYIVSHRALWAGNITKSPHSVSSCRYWGFLVVIRRFYPRDVYVSAVLATATWLAGWLGGWLAGCLSVTRHYCIKTVKPILKLFRPSDSPIILVSSDPYADIQFQGNPISVGYKYTGVGKIVDFRRKSPEISETVRDRPMVTMERHRKSWVSD